MNWQEIKDKHTKAFDKLIEWLNCSVEIKIEGNELVTYHRASPAHVIMVKEVMEPRRLYDLFDEHRIYIMIDNVSYDMNTSEWTLGIWWQVKGQRKAMEHNHNFGSRKGAEYAAFNKAFGVLENTLKDDISQR